MLIVFATDKALTTEQAHDGRKPSQRRHQTRTKGNHPCCLQCGRSIFQGDGGCSVRSFHAPDVLSLNQNSIHKQQRIAEHFSHIRLDDPHIYHDAAINGFEDLKECATKWSRLTRRNETHEDLRAKFKADHATTTDILNIGKALAKRDQVELSTEKDAVAASIFGDMVDGEVDPSSAEDAMKQVKKAVLREVQVTIS